MAVARKCVPQRRQRQRVGGFLAVALTGRVKPKTDLTGLPNVGVVVVELLKVVRPVRTVRAEVPDADGSSAEHFAGQDTAVVYRLAR